jgi:hypothetical protein
MKLDLDEDEYDPDQRIGRKTMGMKLDHSSKIIPAGSFQQDHSSNTKGQ